MRGSEGLLAFGSPIWLQIYLACKKILNLVLHNLHGTYGTITLWKETTWYFFLTFKKISAALSWRQTCIWKLAFIFYSFTKNLDKLANFGNSYYVLIQYMKKWSKSLSEWNPAMGKLLGFITLPQHSSGSQALLLQNCNYKV